MIYENILATIGRTPVVKINRLAPAGVTMYVKCEFFNPLGSVKDRIGVSMIDALEAHYQAFVTDLVKTDAARSKARAVLTEHFEFLNIILRISFNEALNKDILAQGELMSTKLFCCYLEEKGIGLPTELMASRRPGGCA